MPQPRIWVDEIRDALAALGGQASLAEIYHTIEQRNRMDFSANPNWRAAVRRTIQQHSSDTTIFTGLAQDNVFFAPRGKGVGYWALRPLAPSSAEELPSLLSQAPLAGPRSSAPQRIFVSHSHKDNKFTKRLVTDLQTAGADVWVDLTKIAYNDFVKKINDGLTNRQWLVLVQTPHALRSAWVQLEVNAAIALVVQKRMRAVIPFIARPCESDEIPPLWAILHAYDATRNYQMALNQLLGALELT